MKDHPDDLEVADLLSLLGAAVDDAVLRSLAGTGLRRSHGYLVQRLLLGPATATEMADTLGVSQQAVSKLVTELVGLGHVEVVTDPTDGRRRPVRLTASGRRAVRAARRTRAQVDRRLQAAWGQEEYATTRAQLVAGLGVLGIADDVRRRRVAPSDDLRDGAPAT